MRYAYDETAVIVVAFSTGATVSIDIYDLSDDSLVVDGDEMTEIGQTGLYKYAFNPNLPSPGLKHYLYIASDGEDEQPGILVFGPDEHTDIKDLIAGDRIVANNQLIFYRPGGQVELARFNLLDSNDAPTMTNVYKRVRV